MMVVRPGNPSLSKVLILLSLFRVSFEIGFFVGPVLEGPSANSQLPEWRDSMGMQVTDCPDRWTCQGYDYSKLSTSARGYYSLKNCACDELCILLQDCCPDALLPSQSSNPSPKLPTYSSVGNGTGRADGNPLHNKKAAVAENTIPDFRAVWEESRDSQKKGNELRNKSTSPLINADHLRLKENNTYTDYSLDKDMFSCVYDATINRANNVSVVTRCPEHYDDMEVTLLCQNVTDDDMMTRLPVSGKVTRVLYRNMFCAMCHQEPFLYWGVGANCSSKHQLPYDHNSTSLHDLLLDSSKCKIVFQPPGHDYRWRPCLSDVTDRCNDSFPANTALERHITASCEDVRDRTQRMVFGFMQAYRNQYCALCNHYNLSSIFCVRLSYDTSIITVPDVRERPSTYSFSILLDINANTGSTTVGHRLQYKTMEYNETASCEEGQVYDPFRSTCRPITCGPGRYFIDNMCKKDNQLTNEGGIFTKESGIPNMKDHIISKGRNISMTDCSYIQLNDTEYHLFQDGSLELLGTGTFYNVSQYVLEEDKVYLCVNYSQNYTRTVKTQVQDVTFTFSLTEAVVSTCGICISLLALAVTIFVYASLRPLRNIPGQNLLSLVCSLFLADLLLLVAPSAGEVFLACAVIAGVMHYFFLASFLWMNVMAMDVWFTFSKAFVKAGDRGKSSKRFIMYSMYSWLTPVALVLPAALVQILKPGSRVSPQYGLGICWLGNKYALLLFFAAPLFLLLILNVIFFIISARNISQARRTTARMLGKEEEGKMAIYVKLTMVMGITWVLGFLAALVPNNQVLTYGFVIMNTLQGLFICLSFVFTKKVLSLLKDKFCGRRRFKVTKSGSTDMTNVSKSLSNNRKMSSASTKSHNVVV